MLILKIYGIYIKSTIRRSKIYELNKSRKTVALSKALPRACDTDALKI